MAGPRKTAAAGSGANGAAGSKAQRQEAQLPSGIGAQSLGAGFLSRGTLAALKMRLGDDRFEGIDEDGQTQFFHELIRGLFDPNKVPEADLRRYDLNVVAHWQAITALRNKLEGHELQMKYFQYLSLLFTELYLDWYFNHRQDLLDGLNEEMTRYRAETGAEPFRDFEADDLNKIAFWNATGSGKTLLLHVNIRQYLHYFQAGRSDHFPDKIILLTPNEGLSRQHLEELHLSGFGSRSSSTRPSRRREAPSKSSTSTSWAMRWVIRPSPWMPSRATTWCWWDEGHRGGHGGRRVDGAARCAGARRFCLRVLGYLRAGGSQGHDRGGGGRRHPEKRAKMLFTTTSLRSLDDGQKAQLVPTAEDKRRARITATVDLRQVHSVRLLVQVLL